MLSQSILISKTHAYALHSPQNIGNNLLGGVLSAKIGGLDKTLGQVGIDGTVDSGGGLSLSHKLEHDSNGADGGNGVGDSTALNVGSRTVARLADSEVVADVGGGHNTERANKRSSAIGQDVAVEVGGDDNIVGAGGQEHLVDHRVDNLLLVADALVAGGIGVKDGADTLAEQAIRLRQHVGLVRDGEQRGRVVALSSGGAKALTGKRQLQRNLSNALGGGLGDALDGLGDAGAVGESARHLLLDVQVLGVFADDDKVDGLRVGVGGHALDGADVGVQVEALAERDDGGAVAGDLGGGGGDGAEQRTVALLLEGLDRGLGEGGAGGLESAEAGFEVDEAELQAEGGGEGLEDLAAGGDDLAANSVSGYETYWRTRPS